MSRRRNRRQVLAQEIEENDLDWLRGDLPENVGVIELDDVEYNGAMYERAPGSSLYLPTADSPTERAIEHFLADAEEPEPPIGIDLFCGAGGFSLGVHEAGFDVVAAVEWDVTAAHTYMINLAHPNCELVFADASSKEKWRKYARKAKLTDDRPEMGTAYRASSQMEGGCRTFFLGDICKLTGQQIMESVGIDHVDLVFGGPPCQGLSTSNAKACLEDPRNALLWEFMRIVGEIRPQAFMIENVPALLTVARGALFNALSQMANEYGYDVVANKLNAASFGVPQHRVRAIVVGTRPEAGGFAYPMPTTWAIGRPMKEKGWQIGGGEMGNIEEDLDKKLPAKAKYDPATRRWSVPDKSRNDVRESPKTHGKRSKAVPRVEQMEADL